MQEYLKTRTTLLYCRVRPFSCKFCTTKLWCFISCKFWRKELLPIASGFAMYLPCSKFWTEEILVPLASACYMYLSFYLVWSLRNVSRENYHLRTCFHSRNISCIQFVLNDKIERSFEWNTVYYHSSSSIMQSCTCKT